MRRANLAASLAAVPLVLLSACGTTPSRIALPIVDDGPYVDLPANAAQAAEAAASAASAAQRAADAAVLAAKAGNTAAQQDAAKRAAVAAADAASAAKAAAAAAQQAQAGMNPINPNEQRYKMGEGADAKSVATAGGRILPTERTYKGVLAQLDAHIRVWNLQAEDTQNWSEKLSNTTFAGAVIGGLGVLADSLDVGKFGAAVGGGASIWSNQYKWTTQAENYRRARDVVDCMRSAVARIPETVWVDNYNNGYLKMARKTYLGLLEGEPKKSDNDNYDNLATVFDHIHLALQQVRNRLEEKQRQVIPAAAKPEDIAAALKAQDKQQQQSSDTSGRTLNAGKLFDQQFTSSQGGLDAILSPDEARRRLQFQRFNADAAERLAGRKPKPAAAVTNNEVRAEQVRELGARKTRLLTVTGLTESQVQDATDLQSVQGREDLTNLNGAVDNCASQFPK